MKKIIALAAALLLAATAFAQDARSIYNKYSDEPGTSAVYISPAMFRMIGKLPDIELGDGMNLAPIIKNLKGMYIINSENPQVSGKMKDETNKLLRKGDYELMMEIKEDGETIRMFTSGTEEIVTGFLFMAIEMDECTFICLDGTMNRKDLEAMIANAAK